MMIQRGVMRQPPERLRGAWAGEIGQTHLMPSAVLMFATTPDGDDAVDLIHNSADALASTDKFLQAHGWQRGAGWDEGEPNFAAIPEWNPRPSTPRPSRCLLTGLQGDSTAPRVKPRAYR
jgi:membrane-bound lytic murein transglycosylase B